MFATDIGTAVVHDFDFYPLRIVIALGVPRSPCTQCLLWMLALRA